MYHLLAYVIYAQAVLQQKKVNDDLYGMDTENPRIIDGTLHYISLKVTARSALSVGGVSGAYHTKNADAKRIVSRAQHLSP